MDENPIVTISIEAPPEVEIHVIANSKIKVIRLKYEGLTRLNVPPEAKEGSSEAES